MQVKNYEEILWQEPVKKQQVRHLCTKCKKTYTKNYWFCGWCLSQLSDEGTYTVGSFKNTNEGED